MSAFPPELSPHDQRRHLFFWLGVFVLPVFWSWFTLGRRFSAVQRKLAFGWMASYVLLLACAHEWLALWGGVLQADARLMGGLMFWISWGACYWVMLHKRTFLEVLALSWLALLKWVLDTVGAEAMGPFLLMLLVMVLARMALAMWEKSLTRGAAAHCALTPA